MGEEYKSPEKCESLKELFDSWKEYWRKSAEYRKKTIYKDGNKEKCCFEHDSYVGREEWFFPDGFLGNENNCEILFISKESHEEEAPKDSEFYMKKVVNKIQENKGNDGGIRYPRHMAAIKDAISKENKGKKWSDFEENNCFETLKDCGYMNLNKHGGKAKTPPKPFEGLVMADNKKIKQQIIIMKPKKIVLLGADLPNLFSVIISNDEEFENFIKDKTIYVADHPAAFISYDNYKKRLRKLTLKRNEEGVLQWNESKE